MMGKVANMASKEDRFELSKRIKNLKDKNDLTFAKLNSQIGRPCTTSTLQIRVAYPNKDCSQKLLIKINEALNTFEGFSNETIVEIDMLKKLRDEAIKDIAKVFDEHIERIQHYIARS